MEFSVKKRINRILENIERTQELAGLSDPQKGYVAPINAYEDNFEGLQNKFGKEVFSKIQKFIEGHFKQNLEYVRLSGTDLIFKIPSGASIKDIPSNQILIRFGGYMDDARSYTFNLGYKDQMNQDVFVFKFTMDLSGNINNWQSMKF